MKTIKTYFLAILIPVMIGLLIGIIISPLMDYVSLIKPIFSPPGVLFPIVWTILYVLMGISYGILKSHCLNDKSIQIIYYLQLFVNAFWSIFFFTFHLRFFSFLWILLLDVLVTIMTFLFYKKNKIAGIL